MTSDSSTVSTAKAVPTISGILKFHDSEGNVIKELPFTSNLNSTPVVENDQLVNKE